MSSFMNLYLKLKFFQVFNHIMLVLGLVYVFNTSEWFWLGISLVATILICTLGITCGFHRLLSHQSYKTSRFWEIFLTVFGLYATMGSSITWVGVHRLHHAKADKPKDPHSPYVNRGDGEVIKFSWRQGIKSWINMWNLEMFTPRYVAGIIRDPVHNFFHVHYYKILFVTAASLALIDPLLMVFVYCIPACLTFHCTGSIIVIAHIHGYRNHNTRDKSTNSWIANIVTLGDGWHNNHHAHPGNWTTQEKWWELDPAGWFIRLIKK